ncbi:MAG: APC family permease [Acidobacteria bacterium]|nr:APC family permease [Acidobacteriota bacterium]
MSEQNELPPILAKTHSRFKTPYISILLTAAITLVLTIQSSFLTALTIATVTRLLVYATTCLALPVLRRRTGAPAGFLTPMGVVAAVLSLALIGWLLTRVDFAKEGLPILVAAGVGLLLYAVYRFIRRKNSPVS